MFKQLMRLLKNPDIIDNLEKNNNKLKDENQSLKQKLYNTNNENQSLSQKLYNINNEVKYSISRKNFYKKEYNRLNYLIHKIKKVNNLKGNTNLAYEIKTKLNMYNIYKDTYYSKNPNLNHIDNNSTSNKTYSDISHYNFEFSMENPMNYSEYYPTSKSDNKINDTTKIHNNTHLLKEYLKYLRVQNYDKFNELLFNTPQTFTNIFYNYINTVKQKENELKIKSYKNPIGLFNKYNNSQKIDYTSINEGSYFLSISSSDKFQAGTPYADFYYKFQYIFNTEKGIIVFEVIRRMLLGIDTDTDGILKNRILNIIKNTKFEISSNQYVTYPFYNGNNPNDYIIHDTKNKINLNNAYVPYSSSEIEEEMISIDKLTGHQFENYISNLLKKLGYENVQTTQSSNDYGLDNIGYNRNIKYGFQCKHYKSSVGYRAISELVSGCELYNAKHGIVITNSYFSKNAIKAAENMNVVLWDREKLREKILDSGK